MRPASASVAAAGVAVAVYLTALGNGFALDDSPIVERNPAAHTVGAALRAFDEPYWPAEHGAGQWRPLVILSFAADWSVSGGSTAWLHASNVLWHATASALLVPVLAAYVSPPAALAGAVVFAAHPVHVEAVANLVGRAELMAAVWLFAAILLARAVRRRHASGRGTGTLEAALLGAVAAALMSKEHAAIALALLLLDDVATRPKVSAGLPWRDYAAVAALTAVWFLIRSQIDAGQSFKAVAPTFFHLDTLGRVSTMLPVVFVVVRLLVWPFDLSPDYHPLVIERLEQPTPLGLAGLLLLLAFVALAFTAWRRDRAVSAGLFLVGIAWLPTANFLFPTGIVIAERALYLASAGLALAFAAAADAIQRKRGEGVATLVAVLIVLPLGLRARSQIPAWKSNRDLVLRALATHPESYRVHEAAARVFRRLGQNDAALREYRIALELFPLDHFLLAEIGSLALDENDPRLALAYLRRAEHLDTNNTLTQQLLGHALLRLDSASAALPHARLSVAVGPTRAAAARVLAASFVALGQRDSALAVWPAFGGRGGRRFERWLYQAATYSALGIVDSARVAFDSARALAPTDSTARRQLREARAIIDRTLLHPP
ncbi:MAG: hypothetical protein A2083_01955 [Gemmatimonadetes bacterium GWC2_71_9]|nr:MAG: hypothetical protein A2083_01955 [Gemmatimonadetes bacterium GWC2_71_9]OGT95279.1 MAG: hypothetical protein A3I79_03690 [Gemmatimonadetes bacterium RIFCSPLOWO2_02_FULL_71_11]